jgi:hypothetical protein
MASAISKEAKAQIKSELESFLNSYSGDSTPSDVVDERFNELQQAPPIDFEEMSHGFKKKAVEITDSLFKFYVDLGLLTTHDYVKQKKELDNMNIETLFFQHKTIKMAIERIMEEINQGAAHPRLFEVMSQLQDRLTNVAKTQANYMLFLEDTYKKIKGEVDSRGDGSSAPSLVNSPVSGEYYVTAGTKNIMREIGSANSEKTDLDFKNRLTNPTEKNSLMEEKGLSHLIEKENEEDDLGSTIFEII